MKQRGDTWFNVRPPAASALSFESWREWWFGYLCQPDPDNPGHLRQRRLEIALPSYAPFASATIAATMLAELFRRANELPALYSRAAVAAGLWHIAQPLTLEYSRALWDDKTSEDAAVSATRAMFDLFQKLFAPQCEPAMCSGGSETGDQLNSICYMWFDLIGLDHGAESKITGDRMTTALETLDRVLSLSNIACQESALHGLGHIAYYKPALAKPIVEKFLRRAKSAPPKLRRYAELAAVGHVQ